MRDIDIIKSLTGEINEQDLQYVDSWVCKNVGIFIPSVGFCGYAIQKGHTHPSYSFTILFTQCDNVIKTDLQPGENYYAAAMLPPGIPHEEKQGDEFVRYIAIMVSDEFAGRIFKRFSMRPYDKPEWCPFLVSKEIMTLIDRFTEEYETNNCDDSVLEALGYLIANDLIKSAATTYETGSASISGSIRSAVDYIHQNFSKPLAVGSLANHVQMSVSTFARKFKRETGMSPVAYILRVRLTKAKRLLRSKDLSITEIAVNCGFSSAAHLTSSFKKQFGMTPSEYRLL